jgi:chemotaxis protein MotB
MAGNRISNESPRPIMVKRVKRSKAAAHGGAWKIAYADFVTAMMAFFLLMWLLGSTTKGDLQGIAAYFQTPLKVAMAGGSGSGDSSSVLQGGGKDLTRRVGQVKNGSTEVSRKDDSMNALQAELERAELIRLSGLKEKLDAAIERSPTLKQFRNQLLIDITTEGLRIQIVDEQNRPMFALASADLRPYTKQILREIGAVLNDVPNKISLSGHTDATPYSNGEKGYSNWELSADRANASRRELISGGMNETKVLRVVGLSAAVPIDKSDPFSPTNRRISIIVMNHKTADLIVKDGGEFALSSSDGGEARDPDRQSSGE